VEILRDFEDTLSWELEELLGPRQDWKKPGFFFKSQPSEFHGFFWVAFYSNPG